MLTTDQAIFQAIVSRDGDVLRQAVPEGVTRQLTIGSEVYTIRRELRGGRDIVVVCENGRLLFSESVPADRKIENFFSNRRIKK